MNKKLTLTTITLAALLSAGCQAKNNTYQMEEVKKPEGTIPAPQQADKAPDMQDQSCGQGSCGNKE